jgi:hypothetical protein
VAAVLLVVSPATAADPPKYATFTPEALRDAIMVIPRRSYAAFGFNDPAITVRLPPAAS